MLATDQARSRARAVLAYFVPLTFLLYVIDPIGPFSDIALTYIMKDSLHLAASESALVRILIAVPVYLAFLFGLVRDRWNPFGLHDRGYLLLFGPLTALAFVALALRPLDLTSLILGLLLVMALTRFVTAAYQGLMALIAQEQAMSGRLATVAQFTIFLAGLLTAAGAGVVAQSLSVRRIFLLIALAAVVTALFGLWRPRAVFSHTYSTPLAQHGQLGADLRRLCRHRAVYPAVLLMLLFQFNPGSGIVLQYYMTDVLHASDALYGLWYAVFLASFLPMFALYGYLCQRVPFGRLLAISTLIAIPQMLPLLWVQSAWGAIGLAVPIGLLGGLMWAAINDLAMRACPPGLHGTLMMVVSGVNALGLRGGDWIGTQLYAAGGADGMRWCVWSSVAVYASLLALLRLLPADIAAARDGDVPLLDEAAQSGS